MTRAEAVAAAVIREIEQATRRHGPMHSPHEGHSVIREELDELWDHIRADTARSPAAMREAVQIAAMAIRYVVDLGGDPIQIGSPHGDPR